MGEKVGKKLGENWREDRRESGREFGSDSQTKPLPYSMSQYVAMKALHFTLSIMIFLADPGEARGCSTNSSVTHSVSNPFPPTALRRRHAKRLEIALPVIK